MEVRDPGALRALAHPLRFALLELLLVEGEATATRCAELLDESPSNLSFHLRTLAKHGYIEEVPGATGRQRPWRLVDTEQRIRPEDSEAGRKAGAAFNDFFVENEFAHIRSWLRRAPHEAEWRDATNMGATIAYVTRDELRELGEEISALLMKHDDRLTDASLRPKGSRPVRLFVATSVSEYLEADETEAQDQS
jgi:DNA-binding transcriptional ArsR family regulator